MSPSFMEDSTSEVQALSGVEPSERSQSEPEIDNTWQPKRKQLSVKAKYHDERAKRRIDNAERRGRRQSDQLMQARERILKELVPRREQQLPPIRTTEEQRTSTTTTSQLNQTCQLNETISQSWQPEDAPQFQQQIDSFAHRNAEEENLMERLFLAVLNETSENTAIIAGMIGEFDSMMVRKAINDPQYLRLVIAEAQQSLHESWNGRDAPPQAYTQDHTDQLDQRSEECQQHPGKREDSAQQTDQTTPILSPTSLPPLSFPFTPMSNPPTPRNQTPRGGADGNQGDLTTPSTMMHASPWREQSWFQANQRNEAISDEPEDARRTGGELISAEMLFFKVLEITHEDTQLIASMVADLDSEMVTMAWENGEYLQWLVGEAKQSLQESRGFTQKEQKTTEPMQHSTTSSPPGRSPPMETTPKTGSQTARSVSTTPETAKTTRTRSNGPKGSPSYSPSTPSTPSTTILLLPQGDWDMKATWPNNNPNKKHQRRR